MAPEQIEGGEVDARTDVFALGVLMYECLVGHLPFEGKNPAQVLRRVLDGTYPAADRERPTVGGRWSRIIAAALARDAAARTPTAGALGEQILDELSAVGIAQPRAEIQAYFQNPQGYSAELASRLVPRLVARGEAARKAGDVPGAAADYNRALALAPNDLTILKRITSLTSSQSRRLLARRVLLLAGASTVLGFSAYGVARYLKPSHNAGPLQPPPTSTATLTAAPTSVIAPGPPSSSVTAPDITAEPVRSTPSADPSAPRPKATAQAPASPPAGPRKVRFSLIPNGAKLTLNGQPVNWFGVVFPLQPGPQSVRVHVPGSRCCEPEVGAKMVLPAPQANPDEVQTIVIKLKILPSSVTLSGAPAGGQYACPGIGLSGFGGASRQVTLPDAVWIGKCEFKPASGGGKAKTATVTLKAGEPNTIAWPGGPE
jgi:serine/threonine-protein kinase